MSQMKALSLAIDELAEVLPMLTSNDPIEIVEYARGEIQRLQRYEYIDHLHLIPDQSHREDGE